MIKKIVHFFDKLEDKIRTKLSRHPVVYTLIGGVAIVLFWRGVERTADLFPFLTGPVSLIISIIVLLMTGLFVSFFIGDSIIISGLKGEKKEFEGVAEAIQTKVRAESVTLENVKQELDHIREDIHAIREDKKN